MKLAPTRRLAGAILYLALGWAAGHTPPAAVAASVPDTDGTVLAAWRTDLEAIPLPGLQGLDPAVAAQLQGAYDDVRVRLADPNITGTEAMEAYGLLGQLFHAYDLLDVAELSYRNARRLAPRDYRWLHLLADVARRRGDLDGARLYHEAALQVRPKDLPSLLGRGEACLGLNLAKPAEESFRAALQIDPSSATAHAGLGQLALRQHRFSEAVAYLQAALEAVPEATRLHYSLAMAYRGLGEADEARRQLALSGSVGMRSPDPLLDRLEGLLRGERVHLVRGRLAYANGRFPEAATEFAAAVAADPQSVRALVNLAATESRLADVEGALGHLRQAIVLAPENTTARFNLGTLLASRGRHAEAVEHFRAVIEANPRDAEAHLALARSLRATGDDEAALRHFARAAEADPHSEDPVLEGAGLLVRLGRYQAALAALEAGHQRMPLQGQTAHVLAYLLAVCPDPALRDGARSLDLASRVYAAAPGPEHARTLAAALGELGRCDEAAAFVRRVLESTRKDADPAVIARLERDLSRYAGGPPCRAPLEPRDLLPEPASPAAPGGEGLPR